MNNNQLKYLTLFMKNQITKVFFLATIFACIALTSIAQSDKVWSVGPELGLNFSKFGKDADYTDYNAGLLAGGFVTYSITNTYAFTAKVLFSQKGAADNEGSFDNKVHLNYVEIPVLARIFFNREGTVRPNVFLGPSFGFLNGASVKIDDGDYEKLDDYKDSYNTFDLGISAGLGVNVRVANEMYLIIDARYTYGLSDVSVSNSDVNNQAVAISAGLSFGIGN